MRTDTEAVRADLTIAIIDTASPEISAGLIASVGPDENRPVYVYIDNGSVALTLDFPSASLALETLETMISAVLDVSAPIDTHLTPW